ncbi:MAG: deoxyribodipyrimidine photo-lyase [Trueperaceae bacterium]|nr:deoxyribodipyrimidine photo-lyase [Trueperaceae bacterium]
MKPWRRLRADLHALGNDLMIRNEAPEIALPGLVALHETAVVHVHGDIGTEEQAAEQRVKRALAERGARLEAYWARTLYHPDDLPVRHRGHAARVQPVPARSREPRRRPIAATGTGGPAAAARGYRLRCPAR